MPGRSRAAARDRWVRPMVTGTRIPGPARGRPGPAPGTGRARHGRRRGHWARLTGWVWHGRPPRGHRTSADTKEIGFPGPFFTRHREIARRPGMASRRPGLPPGPGKTGLPDGRGRGYHSPCTWRVPPVYLSRTWLRNSRPAANVTQPRRACPVPVRDRDAALRGQVAARSTAGQCQASGRSAGGQPGVQHRSMPGQWRLAAWASAPIRYPVTRSPHA